MTLMELNLDPSKYLELDPVPISWLKLDPDNLLLYETGTGSLVAEIILLACSFAS